MLNSQWMYTFKTLIEVGHFTKTAKELGMTQPGVSQQIQKLEEACGCELITREKKSFNLTEKGMELYQYAVKRFEEEEIVLDGLKSDGPYRGHCNLYCSGAVAMKLYPKILKLQSKHPELVVHLEAAPKHKIVDSLNRGTHGIGIITEGDKSSFLGYEEFGDEHLCLVLPKRYNKNQVTADILLECGVVDHPDAKLYLSMYLDGCGNSDLASLNIEELKVVSYVNQLAQIPLPVSKGIGFTVIPKSALESFSRKSSIFLHNPKQIVSEKLFWVQRKNVKLPIRYSFLMNQLKE